MKYGLIIPAIETREQGAEHVLGSSNIKGQVINPSGDWSPYFWDDLKEIQAKNGIDPLNCTAFGTTKSASALVKFHTGEKHNFSDRALGIAANTDPTKGNDPHKVAETARKEVSLVPESSLPFSSDIQTLEQYYQPKPLTQELKSLGQWFYDKWELGNGWVFQGGAADWKKLKLKEALTKGPVCVSVYGWMLGNNGRYEKPPGAIDNHWTFLLKYDENDCPVIFDSYADGEGDPFLKTLDPLYDFAIAKFYFLEPAQPKLSLIQAILNWIRDVVMPDLKKQVDAVAPVKPVEPVAPAIPVSKFDWSTPQTARRATRLICEEEGLTTGQENDLCATVEAESGYKIGAKHENIVNGQLSSTDWGIAQINDYWHIGKGKSFPSVQYVIDNPEACIRWMARLFKVGKAHLWSAYKNGSYQKYL